MPKELEDICERKVIFLTAVKKEQLDNFHSVFTVMKIITDTTLISTYCSTFDEEKDKGHMSRLIEDVNEDRDENLSLVSTQFCKH